MKHITKTSLLVGILAAAVTACAGKRPAQTADGKGVTAEGARGVKANAQPIGPTGSGSALLLARIAGRRVALVADADAKAVLTVDAATRQQIGETKLDGAPAQVWMARDGRVFVAVRDASKLVVLRPDLPDHPLTKVAEIATHAEPVGLAATPDERTILVTSAWDRRLAAYDTTTFIRRFATKLPREPRGVVVSDDGKTAFVAHAVGSVASAVDLTSASHAPQSLAMRGPEPEAALRPSDVPKRATKPRPDQFAALARLEPRAAEARRSCQSFVLAKSSAIPNRIFAPQVMVEPGNSERPSSGYGSSFDGPPEIPEVAIIDEDAAKPLLASMASRGRAAQESPRPRGEPQQVECLLPRAAAIDPATRSLLVTCLGIDRVVAYDATSVRPGSSPRHSWNVGAGPLGIAVDPETREALVFSQFDRTVSTLRLAALATPVDDLGAPEKPQRTALPLLKDGPPADLVVGRILFHASGDVRISNDGRACASCHPDGRDDAITWATPEGPRRSIMLAGRIGATAPYGWDGKASTVEKHLGATFDRLSGSGLNNFELEALVGYVRSLPAPPPRRMDDADKALVARGKALFESSETQCASCHGGPTLSDGSNHDVASRAGFDLATDFNTPSLRFVGSTGPYFHDGRFTSFRELLTQTDGQMGHTKHLSNADVDALAGYLETL